MLRHVHAHAHAHGGASPTLLKYRGVEAISIDCRSDGINMEAVNGSCNDGYMRPYSVVRRNKIVLY